MELTDEHIDIDDFFQTLVATRYYQSRKNNEYLNIYSSKMLEYIILYPEKEELYLQLLSQSINTILDSCIPYYNMNDDTFIDYISELSNYATMFVSNQKYKNIYSKVCDLLKDLSKLNPSPDINWIGIPNLPPVEDEYI